MGEQRIVGALRVAEWLTLQTKHSGCHSELRAEM